MTLEEFINLTKDLPKTTKIGSFDNNGQLIENQITINNEVYINSSLQIDNQQIIEIHHIEFGENKY